MIKHYHPQVNNFKVTTILKQLSILIPVLRNHDVSQLSGNEALESAAPTG